MGTGVSIFLIAVGAILAFAVDAQARGIDLDAIGVILMLVGTLGLLFSLVLWDEWRPGSRRRDYVDNDVIVTEDPLVVEEGPVVRRRVSRRAYH